VTGVGFAFTLLSPAGAVVVRVLAHGLANVARYSAVTLHIDWVGGALAFVGPVVAVIVEVDTLWCAEAARRGALDMHVIRRRLALPSLRPVGARIMLVEANDIAHTARVRAEFLYARAVVAGTLALLCPERARRVMVVAEANRGLRAGQYKGEKGKNAS